MRILIVTEQYLPMVGGVATVTHNLSQDLAAAGHAVRVVAPSESLHNERAQDGPVTVRRYPSFEWPSYDGLRIAFPPVAPLRRLFARFRPEVVHLHSPIVLGNVAQFLAAGRHVPVVATNHYMPENMSPALSTDPLLGKSFDTLAYSYLVSFYNRCDYVTAPTAYALALLREHGLETPGRPISNGIDLAAFAPRTRDEALRRRLGLPADRPLILYVGRLSEEKRVAVLLDALTQVRAPAHLVIGGAGPEAEELRQRANDLELTERVTFLGRVPDDELVPLYRLADIFAMPSTAELQSLSALEALAVGLPVVAANAGALPELVRDGVNGLLFAPEDSAELGERLTQLVTHPALRRRMAQAAIAAAAEHDRQRITQEWPRVYAAAAASMREKARRRLSARAWSEASRWARRISSGANKRRSTAWRPAQRRGAGTRTIRRRGARDTGAQPTA
jgi:glycosyltransferase involved in cell wall biosynthesis